MKKNNEAMVGLPTFLLIVVIVTIFAIALLTMGITQLQTSIQKQQTVHQINTLRDKAEWLATAAYEETIVTMDVFFPDRVTSVVCGGLPIGDNQTDIVVRNNQSASSLFVLFDDGDQFISHSSVKYCGEAFDSYAVLKPGTYQLLLQLKQENGETFVQINQI